MEGRVRYPSNINSDIDEIKLLLDGLELEVDVEPASPRARRPQRTGHTRHARTTNGTTVVKLCWCARQSTGMVNGGTHTHQTLTLDTGPSSFK